MMSRRAQDAVRVAAIDLGASSTTATENDLLETPLNSEWGFDGVVISDWTAVRSLNSARASQDLVMPGPGGPWGEALMRAVRSGEISEAVVDRKVARILTLARRVGALDGSSAAEPAWVEDGIAFARHAAIEGTVLLENRGELPSNKLITDTGLRRDEDVADSPVRWGILGTGGIASTFVTDLRLADSGVAVAVGSRSQGSADRFADKFAIANRHASYESLVADPDVDVIYVATPHPMHHDNAILALQAGKHVLVEKPFTMNAAEAREIVRVARERGLFAMEAMWTRFLPHVAIIRDWLARGVLGDVVTVTADHGQWFAEDAGFRLFAPELGGGALLDLGVYPVSFASMVLGTPSRIVSMSDPAFTGVDAQTSMLFGYDSGAQAVLTCTLRAKSPTRAAIVGSDARIEVEGDFYAPAAVTLVPRSGDPTRVASVHGGRGLRYEADEVARRLAAGDVESPLMPLDETISIMETMDKVLARARQNARTTT